MDIQQIRYFVAVSQELHFNRAAQKVNVTQPTLSHGIKKLEDGLGVSLIERSPQHVKLTAAGSTFLPYAMRILDEINHGTEAVQEQSDEILGTLKIAAIPTICPYLMPDVLIQIRRKAPKLKIELYEEKTSVILDRLKTGQLDLGVLAMPVTERNLACKSIGKEQLYAAVSRNHRLSKKREMSSKDIANERLLILQEGHCFGEQSIEFCKLQRNDPQVIFQGSSLTSVIKLAASGDGITFVPNMAMASVADPKVKFIPLRKPESLREVGISWRLSAPVGKAHALCMKVIQESFVRISS